MGEILRSANTANLATYLDISLIMVKMIWRCFRPSTGVALRHDQRLIRLLISGIKYYIA